MNTESYKYWAKIEEMGSPFNNEPITANSTFLWEEITSPMNPGFFQIGQWGIFPDAKSLGGYVLHKFFFFAFENWLVREEWDDNFSEGIDVNELLRRAEKSNICRYSQDIPLMKKIVKLTEEALKDKAGGRLFDSLKEISHLFNDRWKTTGTWSFSIELFDNVKAVGSEIESWYEDKDFHDSFDISKKEWKRICSNVSESKNQEKYKEVLNSSSGE